MTKQFFLFTLLLLSFRVLSAIDASISFARFQTVADQAYVEVYVHIAGQTVEYLPSASDTMQLSASVEVLILFQQGETVLQFDKYNLNSPNVFRPTDLIDAKRFALPVGAYELRVEIKDNQKEANVAVYNTELEILAKEQQSDIQLLAHVERSTEQDNPFVKYGFLLEPLPYNFYGKQQAKMWFYTELYQDSTQAGQSRTVRYFLEQQLNGELKPLSVKSKRKTASPVVPVLLGLDIADLPSGNYNLVVELRDETEQLLSKRSVFFQRSNPYLNIDNRPLTGEVLEEEDDLFVSKLNAKEMDYALRALLPKVPIGESGRLNAVIKTSSQEAKQLYLLNYWLQQNPNLPEQAFAAYMNVVRAVDNTFESGFRDGFETDRGFIYLKYGRPDDMINVQDEPSAPPYEIWSYNDFPATNQTNIRFLFYNPSLAAGNYVLLHSTAIGELNNPQWELELYRDAPNEVEGNDPFGGTQMRDNFGRRAREYFNDF
ncbi:MAG: GWxTD domain-containing protein [Bacteroidota bacterium]